MRMIPKSEDGHEAEERTESQTKEEQQKTTLEEIILRNIEFKLRKTTETSLLWTVKTRKSIRSDLKEGRSLSSEVQGGTGRDDEDMG